MSKACPALGCSWLRRCTSPTTGRTRRSGGSTPSRRCSRASARSSRTRAAASAAAGACAAASTVRPYIAEWCADAGRFAGNERTLEQLVAAFDATAPLFTPTELADAERAFAWCAEHLMFTCPPTNLSVPGCFNVADMASRLMNPNADRLGAVGLIALTFPDQPNASRWLAHVVSEMRWMLKNGVMADGQWHEPSTRYHGRVLAAFIPLAYGDRSPRANCFAPCAASSHRSCCSAAPRRRRRRLRHPGAEEVRRLV